MPFERASKSFPFNPWDLVSLAKLCEHSGCQNGWVAVRVVSAEYSISFYARTKLKWRPSPLRSGSKLKFRRFKVKEINQVSKDTFGSYGNIFVFRVFLAVLLLWLIVHINGDYRMGDKCEDVYFSYSPIIIPIVTEIQEFSIEVFIS